VNEKNLSTRRQLSTAAQERLRKYDLDIRVGDLVIEAGGCREGGIFRVGKITKRKIWLQHKWSDEWSSYGSYRYSEFQKRNFIRLDKPLEELELEVLDQVKDVDSLLEEEELSSETALAETSSKDMLLSTKRELTAQKKKFELMQAILTRKMNELSNIADGFRKQLEKVNKVLGTVELYLGVHEKIVQIQSGEPTPPNSPLHIRQQILYMSEEFGDPKDQGLDCKRIREFDEWVCEPENLNRLLPEEKGILAIRVRRKDKKYGDPWSDFFMNQANKKTYLLIRNGENVYRIWSGVTVYPRLFPTKKELLPEEDESYFTTKDREEAEFEYKKYGLMIQGLIHRTDIFQPMDSSINVFNASTWQGQLVFIRDDELLLPTGRLCWHDWQKEINKSIKVGSRVIYRDSYHFSEGKKDFMRDRTMGRYGEWVHVPGDGLYTIVGKTVSKYYGDRWKFLYHSGDEVYRGWNTYGEYDGYSERKNKIGFYAYSDEILNYDQIDLEDIEFYINCRAERKNYLDMLPLLYEIRKVRIKELEHEKHFVQLVAQRNNVKEEKVWEAVKWWKLKNKWKRPIEEDDAKALRMIEKRLKGK
jgi:hypothetical protein